MVGIKVPGITENQKIDKIVQCLNILFEELGIGGPIRTFAMTWLLQHRAACLQAYDKIEAVIKNG